MAKLALALAVLALIGSGALLAGGFLGRWHGAGDSLAVFRVALSVTTALFALVLLATPARPLAVAGLALSALAIATLLPHWFGGMGRADAAPEDLSVYQKNLWVRLSDPTPIVTDILASGADIVTLQEVGGPDHPVLAALRPEYPTQVVCPFARVGGVAVLSRFPEREGSRDCAPGEGLVSVDLVTPQGVVRAMSLHLHWPWPYRQAPQVAALQGRLDADLPTVIGGDFNMVRWSHALRTIAQATGTRPVGPARITLRNKRLVLHTSIDHVLASGAGHTELRPTLGSDHNGLIARVGLR